MLDSLSALRSVSLRKVFQVLALLGTLFPVASPAQTANGPEAVIEAYYQAVKDGDCSTAMRLRPGYSREACEAIRDIPMWTSRVLKENDQLAAMLINVEVLRKGKTERDVFQGFVILKNSNEGWLIQTGSYKNATENLGPNDFLKQNFPEAPVDAITQTPLPDTQPLEPVDPVSLYGEVTPTPDPIGAKTETGEVENVSPMPDPGAEGLEVFHAYYDALGAGDCDLAMKLRPGLTSERCRTVTAVLQASATVVAHVDDQVALHAKIAYRGMKDGDAEYLTDFRGFMTVSKPQDSWIIDDLNYQSESVGLDLETYLVAVGLASPLPKDPTAEELARRLSGDSSFSGTGVDFWANGGPRVFGSDAVLASCWSAAELAGNAAEKKTRKTGPGAFMSSPARFEPNVMLTALPKRYHRSIRRVDTGGRKVVALTFDTGEQNNDYAGYDGEIVDYLRKNKIKATFYFGGKWMATHPERAIQLIADPLFEAGNHAWTHGNMRILTGQDAIDQVLFTQAQYELLLEELATRPCAQRAGQQSILQIPLAIPTFRYPYGTCSPETLKMVNDLGLPAVQWDVVSADPARGQTADAMAREILRDTKPGSIVIMHSNGRGWNTGQALPKFIPKLREMGYEFVTVSELLEYGEPVATDECYEKKPGDNKHYDRIFGRGTGD